MESIDPQKAQQIWQRVRGCDPEIDPTALIPLITQESVDAAICLRLSKRLGGRGGPLLRLARQYHRNAGCLRGICRVLTGAPPATALPALREKPAHILLKECYVNSLGRTFQYERYAEDRDYGPVFRRLAATTREQCVTLLELIGKAPQ